MMKKILFTGISGLLGKYFLKENFDDFEVYGISKQKLSKYEFRNFFQVDIVDSSSLQKVFKKIKPDIVIHAASIGSVDFCEKHPDEAYMINVRGTENVLECCKTTGAKMIFTSSNAVYDGMHPLYSEVSPRNPVDVYGKTKKEGEDTIIKSKVPYIIVRLMTMYGWNEKTMRANPVSWVIENLKLKKNIKVVNDIFNNHLYVRQASDVLKKIIVLQLNNEVFNVSGKDVVSRYELAVMTAKVFNLDESLITPVPSSYFKSLAPRPRNTSFDTSKLEKYLKINPLLVIDGLKEMRNENEFKM